MRFNAGEYPKSEHPSKPSDLNRHMVHLPPGPGLRVELLEKKNTTRKMTLGHSFLFVRNPYARLWSAYIDKIFLPEYWHLHGYSILKAAEVPKEDKRHKCGNDATFLEFLTFITKTHQRKVDEHWETITNICAPCTVEYEVIGKMEFFSDDSQYLMDKYEFSSASRSKSNLTHYEHVYNEIEMLTKYNFKLPIPLKPSCLTDNVIAEKLWKAFQFNGYIHRDIEIPLEDMVKDGFAKNASGVFLQHVIKKLNYQKLSKMSVKNQKRMFLKEAYANISLDVLVKIEDIYKLDFELFGYNKSVLSL